MKSYDIIIIGAGVAGMTAALYSLRAKKSVLVIEKESYGGQIAKSPKVENFPATGEISGIELSDNLFEQIMSLGVDFELENVEKIEKEGKTFKISTDYSSYEAKSVIIATGCKPRMLNLEGEDKLIGKGVYYCAICDGPFFKGQEVCLVGDGNSAMQYALMLAGYCKKVTMVTMFDKFFGEKSLEEHIKNTPNIEVIQNATAFNLIGEDSLKAVEFKKSNNELFKIDTNALFVAIGHVPENSAFGSVVELDSQGYIVASADTETKTAGIYAAGDCRVKKVRQAATAAGDGATAATMAINYINSIGG